MQKSRLTYWQEIVLCRDGEGSGSAYTVGKGAYADKQTYLLAGRESCSTEMERHLHIDKDICRKAGYLLAGRDT
jgi:hypothetical protein